MIPDFETARLAEAVEALTPEQRDNLPFGVVRLDKSGVVLIFNRTEAQLSGYKKRVAVGLDFFREVAPCMAAPEMRGRIEKAAARGQVDIEIGWIGDFADPEGEIQIRVMSASDGGFWLFMNRPQA